MLLYSSYYGTNTLGNRLGFFIRCDSDIPLGILGLSFHFGGLFLTTRDTEICLWHENHFCAMIFESWETIFGMA